jgi:hypothetical protein
MYKRSLARILMTPKPEGATARHTSAQGNALGSFENPIAFMSQTEKFKL